MASVVGLKGACRCSLERPKGLTATCSRATGLCYNASHLTPREEMHMLCCHVAGGHHGVGYAGDMDVLEQP
jgi:hypothetical protein